MGLGFEGHALSELHFQNATPPGTGPAAGGSFSLGKLDVSEKCWRWLTSAKAAHKTSAFSVQNEHC